MTIKEIAERKGISLQAAYKRIKRAGIDLNGLKEKGTGQLTKDGERRLLGLFELAPDVHQESEGDPATVEAGEEARVERLNPEVEKLNPEVENQVERLKARVESLEERNKDLLEERDFLRASLQRTQEALERAQQLQAITTAKLPNPVPALPDPDKRQGLRGRLRQIFARNGERQ